ncbi:MAG: hypothetical protein LUC91_06270 [Prevotella sp.]|nr:hypothetical protein [Prevotella sp.]
METGVYLHFGALDLSPITKGVIKVIAIRRIYCRLNVWKKRFGIDTRSTTMRDGVPARFLNRLLNAAAFWRQLPFGTCGGAILASVLEGGMNLWSFPHFSLLYKAARQGPYSGKEPRTCPCPRRFSRWQTCRFFSAREDDGFGDLTYPSVR